MVMIIMFMKVMIVIIYYGGDYDDDCDDDCNDDRNDCGDCD